MGWLMFLVAAGAARGEAADRCGRLDPREISSDAVPTFRQRTVEAVEQLRMISLSLQNDETEIAAEVVDRAMDSWCELEATSEYFRLMAEQQSAVCHQRVTEVIDWINDLYQNQEELEKKLGSLRSELTAAASGDQLSSQRVADLNRQITANTSELAERQRKLQELNDWWWVPGYGFYLAIRTAADNDEARAQSLQVDLDALRAELASGTGDVARFRQLQAGLTRNIETAKWSGEALAAVQSELHAKLGPRKNAVVFLVEARGFWDRVQKIDLSNVGATLKFINELQQDLGSEASAALMGEEKLTLQEELELFATLIDANSDYLFNDGFELCPMQRAVECKAGFAVENGFCWSVCPEGFETRDKVCVKPPPFDLVGRRDDGRYEDLQYLEVELRRVRQELEELNRQYVSASGRDQDRIRARQIDKSQEARAIAQDGFRVCNSVYEGQGICVGNADGMTWRVDCKPNFVRAEVYVAPVFPPGHQLTLDDLQVLVAPPSTLPTKPVCMPRCPPGMADLGSTCGRVFYPPS